MWYLIFIPITLAVIYTFYLIFWLKKQSSGNEKMVEISKAIQEGSSAYLNRQYTTVGVVAVVLFSIILFTLGLVPAIGFLVGSVASALAGYIGMSVAVKSNAKTAAAAKKGLNNALVLAFKAGSVTGFLVVSLGLLAIAGLFLFTENIQALIALGFGASLISVFARLGGGIYTKAADVGTDLVGKVEAGIPEDDPRNPGVIADNVGDNVGDVAGMAADLFETYAVTLTAAMLIGTAAGLDGVQLLFPMILGGLAIIASVTGSFFVKLGKKRSIMSALYKGLAASVVVSGILFWFAAQYFFSENIWNVFGSTLVGLAVTVLMVIITDYYTSGKYRPVEDIADASRSGHSTNIIMGLSVSMESVLFPIIVIVAGMIGGYIIYEIYGIALAVTSMLSVAGIIVTLDSFGPISDNAGGIAEMAELPEETRKNTDALDAVGNTTKAVTKGYAIASAGLAALVLFDGYINELAKTTKEIIFGLADPFVLIGLFLGSATVYYFASLAMKSVGRAAGAIVKEIRRQFKEIQGIMEGTTKPDYKRAVDISTKAALKEMIFPALLPVIAVLVVGFILGVKALGGFLIGSIVAGLLVAISMTSGGAAWDNAKKYIEDGNYGGKGSEAHKAAVTGDTVGDPYKDTAGPAINPFIKVANIVALLIAPFL